MMSPQKNQVHFFIVGAGRYRAKRIGTTKRLANGQSHRAKFAGWATLHFAGSVRGV
jgi:hypothetical protein